MTLDVTTERYYDFWHTVATIGVIAGVFVIAELALIVVLLWRLGRGI